LEGQGAVKLISEYLEKAIDFERMASETPDPSFRADLEKQAAAYRKLAAERARKLGLAPPPAKNSN
jgi:hypothetical protein